MVKKPPATTGDEVNMVQSLGEEDSLSRKCQPTPVFAWKIPRTEEPGGL